jgi:ABC-type Fe3+/spermidine/putrescine transport system ATPase subunit
MPEAHVRLVELTKRFAPGALPAVDNVSLEIPPGSFTTFLGPSGCGKTTTLRMIAGFYEPDHGDIYIGSRRINDVPAHRRKTAMVFQDYALFPHMTVADNVGYGLRLARLDKSSVERRVAETLQFLGLDGLQRRFPNQLSGGQQQRVALARALVMSPEVLLLDEPLSNLDAKLRVSIRTELISIQRQLGLTTIYVTHDQDEALAMSDWVAVMNQGRVVQWGTPWDVYYKPTTAFMADFLGSVNLVRASVVARAAGRVTVQLGPAIIELPFEGPVRDEALLSIRPETLTMNGSTADGSVALPGEVVRRTFLGHVMRYTVRVEDYDWLVDQPDPGSGGLAEGSVTVLVNPRRVHVLSEA